LHTGVRVYPDRAPEGVPREPNRKWGDWNIHVSSNPGEGGGTGGSCYGDSDGPALASTDSNVILGVGSSMTNSMCRGIVYYYRVDTEYAEERISQFLP
jgi:hypothetical protein